MRYLYEKFIPYETRYWIYKIRHPKEFKNLRSIVYESPKGNFSLRSYDERKCIFVHITKTAGTSVAKALFGELPYHYTAQQYRVIFGKRLFNSYFKFAFVRNPWDRLYSAYSYLKQGGWNENDRAWAAANLGEISNFNDFVMSWLTEDRLHSHIHFWPQTDFLLDRKGMVLIDEIAYFETIDEDFNTIALRLGSKSALLHTNKSQKDGYKSAYSPEAIEKVRSLYGRDIQAFGYHFDGVSRMHISNRKFVLTKNHTPS